MEPLVIGSSVAVFAGLMRLLTLQATSPVRRARLRRVSRVLDQERLAFDKRLAKRAALLIIEFDLQTTVPGKGVAAGGWGCEQNTFSQCFVSNSGANDLTGSGRLTVVVV
jgi:hypothetical protein